MQNGGWIRAWIISISSRRLNLCVTAAGPYNLLFKVKALGCSIEMFFTIVGSGQVRAMFVERYVSYSLCRQKNDVIQGAG
jgi:hypothetical protein